MGHGHDQNFLRFCLRLPFILGPCTLRGRPNHHGTASQPWGIPPPPSPVTDGVAVGLPVPVEVVVGVRVGLEVLVPVAVNGGQGEMLDRIGVS